MATYQRFEDLPVWQDAIRLAEGCEDFLLAASDRVSRGKQDQLDRASLSVSNNIAEGFERGSTAELLQFLYIARGSAGEVRSMLLFFLRRPRLADSRNELTSLRDLAEGISRQIRAWADRLQNSDIKGQRHLNDQSRGEYRKRRNQQTGEASWLDTLRQHCASLPGDHPVRQNFERDHGPIS